MTPSELEATLEAAFSQCAAAGYPLSDRQRQIIVRILLEKAQARNPGEKTGKEQPDSNPLAQLTPTERQALLEFIRRQETQGVSWKATLLNDWLQGKNSGAVQFVREQYGMPWLDQITPDHLAAYNLEPRDRRSLQVGDRIEVTNGLWEWVQDSGPCSREWYPCTVVSITELPLEVAADAPRQVSCIIRFDSGAEYEIQGVYDWNRPNWRWIAP